MNTENDNIALQRVDLKNLDPNLSNILVVGIIIAKQKPRIFETQSQRPVAQAVWNFTIRDSLQQYINVTYWGTVEQVLHTDGKFATGDVVEVINPQVLVRKPDDRGELFHPMVTSPYKLTLNDRSRLVVHPSNELFVNLLRYPTKPTSMFVPLQNIQNNGSEMHFAEVLGAVRSLGQIRTITSKKDEKIQVREIELFDHTCPNLKVTLWEPDLIKRSNNWRPRTTILFLTDVKIDWSGYAQAYIAKTTGRTVVTENPMSKEAEILFRYAQTAPIETYDIVTQLIATIPNQSFTDDIVSIKQLQNRVNSLLESAADGNKSFTATIFAVVSQLDLDGLSQTLLTKCGRCKGTMESTRCNNSLCIQQEPLPSDITFDIRVMLTDHTGTLTNCRLVGDTASKILGCTATEFSSMSDDEKCSLKWKFLLERCKIRLAVIFTTLPKPVVSVLQLQLADAEEVGKKLPIC